MKQGAATAKVKPGAGSGQMKTQAKSAKPGSKPLTKSELAENEHEAAADFVVGALLYSLFASNRSEMIHRLLPNGDNN
jgi:hypothetical protein